MTTPAPTPQAALDALKEAEDYLRNCANSPALADKCGAALAQAVTEQQALADMEARKDPAYLERNRCVALVARMALALGRRAGVARTAIEGWSEDWHGCVYIELPTGQASWHFHASQEHLFTGLPSYTGAWDGHDTPTKYERVAAAYAAPKQEAARYGAVTVNGAVVCCEEFDREPCPHDPAKRCASCPWAPQQPAPELAAFDLIAHLRRQAAFSERTFGPGQRVQGVCDHIRKELIEVEAENGPLAEWVDVIILGFDGAWRSGATPEQIVAAMVAKQTKNEGRKWPDWRTAAPGKAIEHDRSGEAAPAAPTFIGDVDTQGRA